MPQLDQCAGCAFRKDTEANTEGISLLTAEICVLGPHAFHCHESLDYTDPAFKNIPVREFREKAPDARVCGGWTRRVRELAQTGYYQENPVETKVYAALANETLQDIKIEDDPDEKAELFEKLGQLLKSLGDKRRRFLKHG